MGPYLVMNGMWTNKTNYIGQQLGFNFHGPIKDLIDYRFCVVLENNYNKDRRAGAEAGLSWHGLNIYGGYFYPVGKTELREISRLRIGARIVINFSYFYAEHNSGNHHLIGAKNRPDMQ
ncbi:MAG: hypothetical protein IAF38_18765 [Bacteroidia bacterium]|nr:hypothetical protein [Bacteroidia bacterium]